jgi:hypothetical protein
MSKSQFMENTYNTESFEAISSYAAGISAQNRRYSEASQIRHPYHSALNRNRIAAEQRDYVEVLGELSAELPYEELAIEYEEIVAQLADAESRLPTVEEEPDRRKLGVVAMADAVVEVMPWAEETAQKHVEERLLEIARLQRVELESRITELRARLYELSELYEAIMTPWPIPVTQEVEAVPPEWLPVLPSNGRYADTGETIPVSENFGEPNLSDRRTTEEKVREYLSMRRFQPHAKSLMTYYFTENPSRTVTVDELMDFIYSHVPEDEKNKTLRNSVTTMLGPKIQGREMQRLMAAEGLVLQYGWQIAQRINGDSAPRTIRTRVYKAIPADEVTGDLVEFRERVQLAA